MSDRDLIKNLIKESESKDSDSYGYRIEALKNKGQETSHIESTVEQAMSNLDSDKKSFVIYGEPQSGKTEMMIALTAKLLDRGFKLVIILMNDNLALLNQNLTRFKKAGLSTIPVDSKELKPRSVDVESIPRVIFSKKNPHNLRSLIESVRKSRDIIVIDDEADYATPNSKINKNKVSTINKLTGELVEAGSYIGVTATPARLDLNYTHLNKPEYWVDFQPHSNYTGQDVFFPMDMCETDQFSLKRLPDDNDSPKFLRHGLFTFLVNSAHLNLVKDPRNYIILIHTSGQKDDHGNDRRDIDRLLEVLSGSDRSKQEDFVNEIHKIAQQKYDAKAERITKYILDNIKSAHVAVMNSDHKSDTTVTSDPPSPFTIIIGGNSISRGVTFNNLLSMFFTRTSQHSIQQDTYIQRARMFGSRNDILEYFELSIPNKLYADWRRAFIFHRLSLQSRKSGNGIPTWHEGMGVKVASSSSIDISRVSFDKGEISFPKFKYSQNVLDIFSNNTIGDFERLSSIKRAVPTDSSLPKYIVDFIHLFSGNKEEDLVIHQPRSIMSMAQKNVDYGDISRPRGLTAGKDLRSKTKPDASHHIFIFTNNDNEARVVYKFNENISFMKGRP